MIAIINQGNKNSAGETRYKLQINSEIIVEFWHRREDGLATCLRKAADAVDANRRETLIKHLKGI